MRPHQPPEPTSLTLNLAPMVDIVMCLIIFFMLATKMVERENSPIDLPAASAAQEAEKRELGRRVVVNVRGEATATLPMGAVQYVVEEQAVSLRDVRRRLEAERRRHSDVRCVIRGDRDLPFHYIEAVIIACARVGVQHVVFAAERVAPEDG